MNFERTGAAMEGQTTTTTVLARDSNDRQATWVLGSLFERVASGAETGGAFGLSLVTQPAGTATPLHVHAAEAEAFYMLDGTMTYRAGEETYHLSQGSFIYLPTGVPHAFRVTGTSPVRFLAIVSPGGLMDLYDEVGRPAGKRGLPEPDADQLQADIARWLEASPRYGIEVIGPPLPA
jgi:quercetin dioxygenase-like cupin family protein